MIKKSFIIFIIAVFTLVNGSVSKNETKIKNVIIVIGDGMGPEIEDFGRYYLDSKLAWDDFTVSGQVITSSLSEGFTDSAAAGTALATGVKTYNGVVGLDQDLNFLTNILEYAIKNNKSTGIVTSDILSGATPASFSAHVSNRYYLEEILIQQMYSNIDLLIGREVSSTNNHVTYKGNELGFIEEGYHFVYNTQSLLNIQSKKMIAVFDHIGSKYSKTRPTNSVDLSYLTHFALDYLSRDENGFFLVIENAYIDKYAHKNDSESTLFELMELNDAVEILENFAATRKDTIIIVTADHDTGGMNFDEEVAETDVSEFFANSITWTTNNHTSSNVNFYMFIPRDFFPKFKKSIILDNTDIFQLSLLYINTDENYINAIMEQAKKQRK